MKHRTLTLSLSVVLATVSSISNVHAIAVKQTKKQTNSEASAVDASQALNCPDPSRKVKPREESNKKRKQWSFSPTGQSSCFLRPDITDLQTDLIDLTYSTRSVSIVENCKLVCSLTLLSGDYAKKVADHLGVPDYVYYDRCDKAKMYSEYTKETVANKEISSTGDVEQCRAELGLNTNPHPPIHEVAE